MRGLVGYVGKEPAEPIITGSLSKVNHNRAYAYLLSDKDGWDIHKSEGCIAECRKCDSASNLGMACSSDVDNNCLIIGGKQEDVAVMYTGKIPQFNHLKEFLEDKAKYTFDNIAKGEVIPHLIDYCFRRQPSDYHDLHDFAAFIWTTLVHLGGPMAMLCVAREFPDYLAVATNGIPIYISPNGLVVNHKKCLSGFAQKYYKLDKNELAVGDSEGFQIRSVPTNSFTFPIWKDVGV
jgi:glucosamine 6-phosphate synthetase-like amidotransferase/phosphosugar isomerase protein